MRKFIKANRKKMLRKVEKAILKYVGKISTNVISCAFNVAMTVAGTSIGGLIAAGLDYAVKFGKFILIRNDIAEDENEVSYT